MKKEIEKCKNDILYFKEKYLELDKNEVQDNIILKILKNNKINIDTGSETKKTSAVSIIMLHKFLFETNQTMAVLAKTQNLAKEVLAKITYYYNKMPDFLKSKNVELLKTRIKNNNNIIIAQKLDRNSLKGMIVDFILIDSTIGLKKIDILEFFQSYLPCMSFSEKSKIVVLDTFNVDDSNNYDEYNNITKQFKYYNKELMESEKQDKNLKQFLKEIICLIKKKI